MAQTYISRRSLIGGIVTGVLSTGAAADDNPEQIQMGTPSKEQFFFRIDN